MIGDEIIAPPTLDAGIEYARRLRDPKFRAYLRSLDKHNLATSVVIALGDQPISQIIATIRSNGTASPFLIAISMPDEPFGFYILLVERPSIADN